MKNRAAPYEIYQSLYREYGPRGWWPLIRERGEVPEYFVPLETEAQVFEIAAGAVLTQNTSWKNAARAVSELSREGALSPGGIAELESGRLAELIRSSGYYNLKGERLRNLASFFLSGKKHTRENILAVKGIGPETADSIMLYGFGQAEFVVDAYTCRIFSRLGLIEERTRYYRVKRFFEENLPSDPEIFGEYHALIVEHAKRFCRKSSLCELCPISRRCRYQAQQSR